MSIFVPPGLSPIDDDPQIDLTPLIDCLFMLIIFFVVTMSFSKPVLEIMLPESETAEVKRADRQVSVNVRADGSYWMNNRPATLAEIEGALIATPNTILNIHINLQLLLLFIIPAIAGSVILAKPLYTVFYGAPDSQALLLFVASLIQVIFLALYSVLAPMLQAIFETRKAINYFAIGVLIKAILQLPLIIFLGALGPVISTAIGLGVPIALMYNRLHTVTHFSRKIVFRKALLICIITMLMVIPVAVFYWLFQFVLSPTSRMGSVIYLVIGGGLGVLVYGVLALVTHMADQLLGARAGRLRAKLHIK